MLSTLKNLFSEPPGDAEVDEEHTRQLAAAALLIEVARADFTQDANEERAMAGLLKNSLGLSEVEINSLLERASDEVDSATSLYEFTRLINDHYDIDAKRALVTDMWRVAYADAELDKYEEHMIRRVAELIYLPHEEFIRGKLAARDEAGAQ